MFKFVVAAAAGIAFMGGCASPSGSTGTEASPIVTEEPVAESPTPTPTPTVSTDDFRIKLKVTEQQCFGSAGCMVTVRPKLSADFDALPAEGSVEITYKVSGDESGPVIETTSLDLSTTRYDVSEIMLSTASSSVVPAAKVTDVEYSEF